MTVNIQQRLQLIGDEFTPGAIDATRQLFASEVLRPADVGAQVSRDLSYGSDARQRLDVFHAVPGTMRPVLVFVHGGGFAAGEKGAAESPYYNNVGAWAVRSGFVGVTVTYRLAPAFVWPCGALDIAAALTWLRQNIGRFGGDAQRIVVVAQSAGSAHVAGCLAQQGLGSDYRAPIAGAVFLSGIYEPDSFHINPMHEVYFGVDRAAYPARSTVLALAATQVPCLFTISEYDPSQFQRQLAAVFEARTALTGRCPEVLWQHGHNHFSTSMQIGGPHDTLGEPLAQFVRRACG